MTPLARLSAVIDILNATHANKRPAMLELKDWQRKNRYAGSKDRAAIYAILQDIYRYQGSTIAIAGCDSPRLITLATAIHTKRFSLHAIQQGCAGSDEKYTPQALTDEEAQILSKFEGEDYQTAIRQLAIHDQLNLPKWVWHKLEANFEDEAYEEASALIDPAPIDIRVNLLKSTPEKLAKIFKDEAKACSISPIGLRFLPSAQDKAPPQPMKAPQFKRGDFEIQDEGSQIVSLLIGAKPGEKILDYCAGAGGKSLALAAEMKNKGQVFAYDAYENRLSESVERIKRSGAHNIQLKRPKEGSLDDLVAKMDRVIVDAPCTGSGTWRRRPDLKWRLSETTLNERMNEQRDILEMAKSYPKIGGFLIYITCSLFMEENEEQIAYFLDNNPNYEMVSCQEVWEERFSHSAYMPWSSDGYSITLTPKSTQTDGFFFAVMERMA